MRNLLLHIIRRYEYEMLYIIDYYYYLLIDNYKLSLSLYL